MVGNSCAHDAAVQSLNMSCDRETVDNPGGKYATHF